MLLKCCVCQHPCGKINLVSNHHARMHKCVFSIFDWKYLLGGNLFQKNQNCQFKLKFSTQTNLDMQNSIGMFTFPGKIPFSGNFGPKNQDFQKLGSQTNSNKLNSMVVFTFSALNRKSPICTNLVQKIKIVCLS